MKGKKILIGILFVVGAVGLGIGALHFKSISHGIRKLVSSPEAYFRYIDGKASDKAIAATVAYYDSAKEIFDLNESKTYDGALSIEFGQAFRKLWNDAYGEEVFNFSDFGITFSGTMGAQAKENYFETAYILNDTTLISGSMWLDMVNTTCYLQLPELSDEWLEFSYGDFLELGKNETETALNTINNIDANLPEAERLEMLLYRYRDLILSEIKTVEREKDTVMLENSSLNCTRLTVAMTGEEIAALIETVADALLEDKELEAMILETAAMEEEIEPESVYKEFRSKLKQVRRKARDTENFKEDFEYSLWVDRKGTVIARRLRYGTETELYYAVTRDKNTFAVCLEALLEGERLGVTGNGTFTLTDFTGEFLVTQNEDAVLEAKVTGNGLFSKKDVQGTTVTFSPVGKFKEALAEFEEELKEYTDISLHLRDLDFVLSTEHQDTKKRSTFLITLAEEPFLGFSYENSIIKGTELVFPDKNDARKVENEADFYSWLAEANFENLQKQMVKAGIPEEWLAGMEGATKGLKFEAAKEQIELGEYRKARDMLTALGEYSNTSDYILFCDAMMLYEKGELQEADAMLDQIEDYHWEMNDEMVACRYSLAEKYFDEKNYEKAEQYYQYVIASQNAYIGIVYEDASVKKDYAMGMVLMERGNYEAAEEMFLEICEEYEPATEALKECRNYLNEKYDEIAERPEYQLIPQDLAFCAKYVTLPVSYEEILLETVSEQQYELYISLAKQKALREGKPFSENDTEKLRKKCEEETYTSALTAYMLEYGKVKVVSEAVVEEKARIDLYLHKEDFVLMGFDWEEYLELTEMTEQELLSMYREERRRNEMMTVMTYAVAMEEGLTVSPEEFDAFVTDLSEEFGVSEEEFLRVNDKTVLDEVFLAKKGLLFLIEHAFIY